jgi:putative Mg2+ transporter-C (MgtC) family protein
MSYSDFIIRLGVAFLVGFAVGLERELSQKEAGLRTNLLVVMGACIFVLVALELTADGKGDPSRAVAEVAAGIGFLGAGVILHRGLNVHGLTTAATVWCNAALGCVAASGFIAEALTAGLFVLLVNAGLRPVDELLENRSQERKRKAAKDENHGMSREDYSNDQRHQREDN